MRIGKPRHGDEELHLRRGQRASPPSRLTAARSPSRCSRTPATGPEGRHSQRVSSRRVLPSTDACSRACWGRGRKGRGGEKGGEACGSGAARRPSPAASSSSSRRRVRDRNRGRERMTLGFLHRGVGAGLIQRRARSAVGSHPTVRGQRRLLAGPWAAPSWAARGSGGNYLPRRAPRAKNGPWAANGHGPREFFLSFVFTDTVL
jgi:hypothetical protein